MMMDESSIAIFLFTKLIAILVLPLANFMAVALVWSLDYNCLIVSFIRAFHFGSLLVGMCEK